MKKHLVAMLITTATGLAMMSGANAADGTIHFTGAITADACTVDADSQDMTVNLGTVASTAFSAAGDKASPTRFTINLGSCPASVTTASVKFDGTADSANNDLLQLDASADPTADASGVGIEIADDAGTAIPLFSSSKEYPIDAASSSASMTFVARYVSTAATVNAGAANATSQFTVNYQ
ncbi:TPA: fimbrial protein [Serratia rubidaea]|uniref:fimbrial protein n=1 Tax=Serratia rubidaea TaxID=61652 RepID=UPI0023B19D46|nr:fimbrial protein [Serratia rubidaea]MDK1705127.1 fimbrial protein [Serratia rubidaea]HDJ1439260.1 fimbrial protein [Serratia rubidaea]HDJ1449797.1 fimbrial protein [Serratia rubidaea]HDJ1460896.1 fimbrial protein [Serratia rubidaea]HDJ2772665.1 fimbrial protein [Serratia rubidaea]